MIHSPARSPLDASPAPLVASGVLRGITRFFARNDIWCLPEMPLRNGRRADLMGIDAKGHVIIVEIKVARADLLGDAKWTDYLDHCDRFFWGLASHLDRGCMESEAFLPDRCGLIVADDYDAELLRPAPLHPARRPPQGRGGAPGPRGIASSGGGGDPGSGSGVGELGFMPPAGKGHRPFRSLYCQRLCFGFGVEGGRSVAGFKGCCAGTLYRLSWVAGIRC
jgi:hypothetical protein